MNPPIDPRFLPFQMADAAAGPSGAGDGPDNSPRLSPAHAPSGGGYQRYREMTIDEMLLENRVVFMIGEINYQTATNVIMRLLYLQNQKKGQDINLYVNSHGGSVDDTLAIYDTMRFLDCKVHTYCIGRAQSGAAVILSAGAPGRRYILPHARVMIHQPFGGVTGQTSDVEIQAEEILRSRRQINEVLAEHTGKSVDEVEADSERDKYFDAEGAREYGLVDEVIHPKPPEEEGDKDSDE
ncbi:MAG: ATP-dependent Clp protease proteolytic subunit [Phycisphaeraceae bacterium]|nr:ATP-dependent Clp protease proteolytic subunit [Phycisphaeraceae bacterium]